MIAGDTFPKLAMRLAVYVAPKHRADWLCSMEQELDHVPPDEMQAFATGCLKVSCFERIKNMTTIPPLRIVPGLLASAVIALLCITSGVRFFSDAPVIATFLLLASVLWLFVYGAVYRQSSQLLAKAAISGLVFYTAIGLLGLMGAPVVETNSGFVTALSVEGLVMFAAVFVVARIPYFWAAPQKPA